VNAPDKEEAGKAMFPMLMEMMWKSVQDGKPMVREFGLCFRPINVDVPKFKEEYDSLEKRLMGYLNG
jgi:hypothetical protein